MCIDLVPHRNDMFNANVYNIWPVTKDYYLNYIMGIITMGYLLNIERSFQNWFNFISYENSSKVQVTLKYFDKLITMITCKRNNSHLHIHKNTNYIHKNKIVQTAS